MNLYIKIPGFETRYYATPDRRIFRVEEGIIKRELSTASGVVTLTDGSGNRATRNVNALVKSLAWDGAINFATHFQTLPIQDKVIDVDDLNLSELEIIYDAYSLAEEAGVADWFAGKAWNYRTIAQAAEYAQEVLDVAHTAGIKELAQNGTTNS